MYLFLDANILIRFPELLALGQADVRFAIPQIVVDELERRPPASLSKGWGALLSKAVEAGRAEIMQGPRFDWAELNRKRLDPQDTLLLESARQFKLVHPDERVVLVSDDQNLIMQAAKLGLEYATGATVFDLIGTGPQTGERNDLKNAAQLIRKDSFIFLLRGFALGICVSLGIWVAYQFRSEIISAFPVWGLVLLALVGGAALFGFRSRRRLAYGIVEICFGLFAVAKQASPTNYDALFLIQVAAGLYIIVRGFDNVEKSISGTRIDPVWRRIFRGGCDR